MENNQSNEFDGIVLSDNAAGEEAVADVKIPENKGTVEKNTQEVPKKKKGKFGKFLAFLAILIALAAGGGYYYINYMCTPDKFIDYSVKKANTMMNNVFNNAVSYNILEDDYLGTGSLEINASGTDYAFLDGLKLDYTIGASLNNDYVSLNGKITQGSDASLTALAFVDKDNSYVKSEDIYPLLINYNLGQNYFTEIKDYLKKSNDYTIDEIKAAMNKTVSYCGEALKEVSSTSTVVGGMYIEYVFNFDKDNYKKFNDKYTELIKNDEQLKTLFNLSDTDIEDSDYEDYKYTWYEDKEITVKVNAITKEVETFSIATGDKIVLGEKTSKNNYKITNDKMIINAEVTDKKIALDISNDGKNMGKVSATIDGNKTLFSIDIVDYKIKVDYSMTKVSNSQMKFDAVVDYQGVKAKNNMTGKIGKSLVKKETVDNYRQFNQLSENEMNYIQKNFTEKISKFKAYNDFYSSHM